jgi:hypothetical protein
MKHTSRLRSKVVAVGATLALTVSGLLPMMLGTASAAQLTTRKIELQSSQPGFAGQNIYHELTFNAGSSTAIGSMVLTYCLTPLGTCVAPTGIDFTTNGVALGTTTTDQTINGTVPGNTYAIDVTGTAGVDATSANALFIASTSANAITSGQTVKLRFVNIENPTVSTFGDTTPANLQPDNIFFVRMATYNTTSYGTAIDDGVVAGAIEPLITVSARVQEILNFCVANTSVNDGATTNPGADCSAITGTTGSSIDLGVVDGTTAGAVSPDTDGNSKNGIFMIRTNAVNGSVVGYRAVQQAGTNYVGSLRVVGASCGGVANTVGAANSSTDQCFNSNTTKTALTASTEEFGVTGRYINRLSSATPTSNLALATDYDSTSTVGYAWTQTGAFTQVASSTASTDKVIDDESVILQFAAVAALTTPTGQYQAQGDFIAVATY